MFISNTATAVLMAPIALVATQQVGVSPYSFLFAVTLGASMCFASPFFRSCFLTKDFWYQNKSPRCFSRIGGSFFIGLNQAFLFSQFGRFFSPTGQVILRAFWITMQRYEIPICQVCDSVRYHAIAEHFYSKHLTFNIEKASVPSDSIAGPIKNM